MEITSAAPRTSAVHPRLLLEAHLGTARDLAASPAVRMDAYRGLLRLLEGHLQDREFARTVHREWMGLSANAPSRRAQRQSRRRRGGYCRGLAASAAGAG